MGQTRPKTLAKGSQGFTIIEILIVMAIVGLLLLILLVIVPTTQRSARNHNRKAAVGYTSASLTEYKSTRGVYPLSASHDERAAFVNGLRNNGPTKNFEILYGTNSLSHQYPYDAPGGADSAMDEVIIIPAHRCNQNPAVGPGDVDYPAESTSIGDMNYNTYAVFTLLEPRSGTPRVYCLDAEH